MNEHFTKINGMVILRCGDSHVHQNLVVKSGYDVLLKVLSGQANDSSRLKYIILGKGNASSNSATFSLQTPYTEQLQIASVSTDNLDELYLPPDQQSDYINNTIILYSETTDAFRGRSVAEVGLFTKGHQLFARCAFDIPFIIPQNNSLKVVWAFSTLPLDIYQFTRTFDITYYSI